MESTFIMIKPNGVASGLVGEILGRYEKSRLSLRGIRIGHFSKEKFAGFYAEHEGKPFFDGLVDFMSSGPAVVAVLYGEKAISAARTINGATNPDNADPGTIRFDFAPDVGKNIVHSSDSPESAQREIGYWFEESELVQFAPKSFKCSD